MEQKMSKVESIIQAHKKVYQQYQIFQNMSRNRKKVSCYGKNQTRVSLVQEETIEFQKIIELHSNPSRKYSTKFKLCDNPYEKIKEIPEIQLTKDDMKTDPIILIQKLQRKYKEYGAVKIKACKEWQPPFSFRYTEKGITTRIQKIHKLMQGKAFEQNKQAYNIKTFTNWAYDFQKNYKFKYKKRGQNTQAQLQYQYWGIVNGKPCQEDNVSEKPKVVIEYAADLPSQRYGSGFPTFQSPKTKDQNFDYTNSHFNLNNIYKAPTSVLKICDKNNQKISGITIPWVYMGMLFSSFCWHVEDLWLNSLNYSHKGATKTWYIIPESDKDAFDAYIQKKVGHRQFLNSITFMIDPLELIENGVQVYKAYQRPHEYILTLFNAYHAGFSQGFNIGEAVNVVTIDSFNVVKRALKKNNRLKSGNPPVICYDWMVVNNLDNKSINQEYIREQYSKLVAKQLNLIKKIVQKCKIKGIEMIDPAHKYDKNTCMTCRCYQFVSIFKCSTCNKKYCVQHVQPCCEKTFLFLTRKGDSYRKKTIDYVKQHIS